ncbi:UNKNOWN [Stylonychia lemnae]|uniref:Uncharacterized protein n=1 Tax=Stylonychia lemnae TaxID=5949 RepID=A0A077ZSN5_STYLE|nr:UNKNOWN [Stylonychia lemnae]|eukprot:CDW71491.1 UNKNOWN [Stylonychia lemnae]
MSIGSKDIGAFFYLYDPSTQLTKQSFLRVNFQNPNHNIAKTFLGSDREGYKRMVGSLQEFRIWFESRQFKQIESYRYLKISINDQTNTLLYYIQFSCTTPSTLLKNLINDDDETNYIVNFLLHDSPLRQEQFDEKNLLKICEEGTYYSPANKICIQPTDIAFKLEYYVENEQLIIDSNVKFVNDDQSSYQLDYELIGVTPFYQEILDFKQILFSHSNQVFIDLKCPQLSFTNYVESESTVYIYNQKNTMHKIKLFNKKSCFLDQQQFYYNWTIYSDQSTYDLFNILDITLSNQNQQINILQQNIEIQNLYEFKANISFDFNNSRISKVQTFNKTVTFRFVQDPVIIVLPRLEYIQSNKEFFVINISKSFVIFPGKEGSQLDYYIEYIPNEPHGCLRAITKNDLGISLSCEMLGYYTTYKIYKIDWLMNLSNISWILEKEQITNPTSMTQEQISQLSQKYLDTFLKPIYDQNIETDSVQVVNISTQIIMIQSNFVLQLQTNNENFEYNYDETIILNATGTYNPLYINDNLDMFWTCPKPETINGTVCSNETNTKNISISPLLRFQYNWKFDYQYTIILAVQITGTESPQLFYINVLVRSPPHTDSIELCPIFEFTASLKKTQQMIAQKDYLFLDASQSSYAPEFIKRNFLYRWICPVEFDESLICKTSNSTLNISYDIRTKLGYNEPGSLIKIGVIQTIIYYNSEQLEQSQSQQYVLDQQQFYLDGPATFDFDTDFSLQINLKSFDPSTNMEQLSIQWQWATSEIIRILLAKF